MQLPAGKLPWTAQPSRTDLRRNPLRSRPNRPWRPLSRGFVVSVLLPPGGSRTRGRVTRLPPAPSRQSRPGWPRAGRPGMPPPCQARCRSGASDPDCWGICRGSTWAPSASRAPGVGAAGTRARGLAHRVRLLAPLIEAGGEAPPQYLTWAADARRCCSLLRLPDRSAGSVRSVGTTCRD